MADDMDLSRWPDFDRKFPSKAERSKAFDAWAAEEAARVADQRRHLTEMPNIRERTALIAAMIARAEELLDSGYPGAADQLLEFVPAADADAFNARYWGEQNQGDDSHGKN
jgi:hypothetical protein